jgi:hypothetical protein
MLLGAWGALIPFIGPYFNFSYLPDQPWTWSQARGWLEVLPGAVTFVGGLLLLVSASRMMTLVGSWLAVAGGAWFVLGPQLQTTWSIGSPGTPAGSNDGVRVAEQLAMFSALGVVIVFLGAAAFGRLSLVSPRDVRAAERRQLALEEEARVQEAREAEIRESALRDARAHEVAQNGTLSRHAAGDATEQTAEPETEQTAATPTERTTGPTTGTSRTTSAPGTTEYTPAREYASHSTNERPEA